MDKLNAKRKKKRRDIKMQKQQIMDGADIAVSVLKIIPAYVMMTTFGFGNKRMERYVLEFFKLYDKVMSGKVTLNTLAKDIEMRTGIRFDVATGDVFNLRKDDEDG